MDSVALRFVIAIFLTLVICFVAAVVENVTGIWPRIEGAPFAARQIWRLVTGIVDGLFLVILFWVVYGRLPQ